MTVKIASELPRRGRASASLMSLVALSVATSGLAQTQTAARQSVQSSPQTPAATPPPAGTPGSGVTRSLNGGPPARTDYLVPAPTVPTQPGTRTPAHTGTDQTAPTASAPTASAPTAPGAAAPGAAATAPTRSASAASTTTPAQATAPRTVPQAASPPLTTRAPTAAASPTAAPTTAPPTAGPARPAAGATETPAAASPVPAVAAPTEAAPPAPVVLTASQIAALPFQVTLPQGYRITTGRPGPDFDIYTIRRGDQSFVMIYTGGAADFPIYDGQEVLVGGRKSIVVDGVDNRKHAMEHLFERGTAPHQVHVWVVSLDGVDAQVAEDIAQSVDVK